MSHNLDEFVKDLASADARVAAHAAEALLAAAVTLSGAPPAQLLAAIIMPVELPQASILNLARAWPRPEMSRATLDALRQTTDQRVRERLAWLLKTVLAPEHGSEAIDRVLDHAEDDEVRLWVAREACLAVDDPPLACDKHPIA
jgi:ATP phosphoribosyltransferase regulatory subunit HisZ